METVQRRDTSQITRGFFRLCHPLPTAIHIVAVILLLLLASWPRFNWSLLLFAIAAHAAMQLAIGVLNDYCDRRQDERSQKNKPIPQGLVRPGEALGLGLLLMLLMVLLLVPLPRLALLVSLCYLGLAMAYNLGLKSTPLSGLVFALAIPLIPVYAFVCVGRSDPFLIWIIPVAALLGIALNLANSLPDIDDDAANHESTLAVILGKRGSILVCLLAVFASTLLIAFLMITHLLAMQTEIVTITLCLVVLMLAGLFYYYLPKQTVRAYKQFFYLIVLTCLLLAVGWLIGVLL